VLVARVNRRAALQIGGATAVTALLAGTSDDAQADERGFSSSGKVTLEQRKIGKPPMPPLEVLVYSRLAFGHRPGDLENFRRLPGSAQDKLKLWLEAQLNPDKLEDTDCAKRVGKFDALDKPLTKSWREYWRDIPDENNKKYEIAAIPTQQTRAATVTRMIWSKRQLLEVVVDFWHNHFNVHPDRDDNIRPIFADWDKNVIRKHAFGNFRQLLEATATHPAMLFYLDQASSNRGGPNENYARELFELHTLGAENYLGVKRQRDVPGYAEGKPVGYVDDDVYEATRCLTGWRVNDNKDEPGLRDDGSFAFYQPWHDRFQKTVLGRYFPPDQAPMKDGRDVLDILAAHPGTARYISRKLCRRLVADNPPQSLVDKAAKVFAEKRDAPDQIKHVLRAIVLSSEFAQTWGEKVKRPLETYVSLCRAFEAEFEVNDDRLWGTYWLGQAPFNHRPPDGYPDRREAWVSSTTLLRAWGFGLNVAHNWDENIKSPVMKVNANRRKPTEIADLWINRLLGRALHPASLREDLVSFLADGGDPNATIDDDDTLKWRVPMAAAFIATSPDFMTK
jgi:uncharacterized protein (DUF1800 family)